MSTNQNFNPKYHGPIDFDQNAGFKQAPGNTKKSTSQKAANLSNTRNQKSANRIHGQQPNGLSDMMNNMPQYSQSTQKMKNHPSQSNLLSNQQILTKTQTKTSQFTKPGTFTSPHRGQAGKLISNQTQSQQHLPAGGNAGARYLGISNTSQNELDHHQSHQVFMHNHSGNLNLINQKNTGHKKSDGVTNIYGSKQRQGMSNFQNQQKYIISNTTSKPSQISKIQNKTGQGFHLNQQKSGLKSKGAQGVVQNLMSNTQNINKQKKPLAYQNNGYVSGHNHKGNGGQSSASATRAEAYGNGNQQLNIYNDVDNQGFARAKNSSGSVPMSGNNSRNNTRLEQSNPGTGISQTIQGEDLKAQRGETRNSKTLYTNISLRELSTSPDRRNGTAKLGKNQKVVQVPQKSRIYQNTQFVQAKRIVQGSSQDRHGNYSSSQSQLQKVDQRQFNNTSLGNYPAAQTQFYPADKRLSDNISQNTMALHINHQAELKNQQIKNYLNQIANNDPKSKDQKDLSVLNIKTVQDINIYNNSFIISGNNIPQGLQNQVQNQQSINSQNEQATSSQGGGATGKKGGLKLRKELSGLTNGLNQVRSASQGRTNARGISQSSSNQQAINQIVNVGQGQTRNAPGAQTEYNSYGAAPASNNLQKISRAYDVYNHKIGAQNIKSLQQNPNQKRILNPSSKVFGNLSAIAIQNGSLSSKQRQNFSSGKNQTNPNYYQNNTTALAKQGGSNKAIKGVLTSKTSRVQSITDSRAGTRQNNGTFDKLPPSGSLTSDSRQQNEVNLVNQNQSSIQQMKKNYLQNQQQLLASNGRNQPQFKSQNRAQNHSQLLASKTGAQNQSQMINIHDIHDASRASDLTHSQIATSDFNSGLSNLNIHSQSQLYQSQKYHVNQNESYEVRKQSLQEIRNHLQNPQQKFRNQLQQLSSDNTDGRSAPIAFDAQGNMVNSMSIKNDQYFSSNTQNEGTKIFKEFMEKQRALNQNLQKMRKACQEVNVAKKEAETKNIIQQLDAFQMKVQKCKKQLQAQGTDAGLDKIMDKLIEYNEECTILRALCLIDLGQNYESIQEFDKICGIQNLINDFSGNGSNGSKQQNSEAENTAKTCQLLMSLAQKRTGEHKKSLETITNCINQFIDFKDAYLVRGQQYLLNKQNQKALQDFMKFDQLVNVEISDKSNALPPSQLSFQLSLGKELIGDAHKKMKKYKQASKSYQEALNEIVKLQKAKVAGMSNRLQHSYNKLQTKIAMCAYYLGQVTKAISLFGNQIKYYSKFDPTNLKVQQKQIKFNFYLAKSILAQKQKEPAGSEGYQVALKHLSFCNNDDIDPELHELYCGNSLFEIFKIFLKQKDIYSAHEYIQRATDNNFNSKRLSLYRDFTEGVMYLMKRKIKKGVQILTDLLEILINGQKEIEKICESNKKQKKQAKVDKKDRYNVGESDSQLLMSKNETNSVGQSTLNGQKANEIGSGKFNQEQYDFLIFNIYVYRSYGYVAIEKYEHALDDLRKAKRISGTGLDKATIYNKWLSRGILKMDTEEYLMASKYFGKASLRFQGNKDAFCLNVISIVRSYSFSLNKLYIDNSQKLDKVWQTKRFLDVAIECCCKEQKQPSLYFFRGLLHYQLHNFYDALNDFNVAIQEEEEATGQFHLARGRCYACLSILDEAMKDLTIALELDETLQEAYIFRGKCAYLLGDNNLAFHDFQKLIISDQKNPIVHIYAGNLLMTTGAYTDAVKAFDNADTVQQTSLAAFQRIRCYCALSDLENAFEQMQLCQHQAPNEKFAQYDFKVLLPLLSCVRSFAFSKNDQNEPDETGKAEQIEILTSCVSQITAIIETYEKGTHLELKKEDSPMTIQIIPNVNKIKLEKKMVQKHLMPRRDGAVDRVELRAAERKELDSVATHGYYRENIFQLEEMYLYRSIFHLYIGNLQESFDDLNRSWKLHFQSNALAKRDATSNSGAPGIDTNMQEDMYGKFPISQLVSPMGSMHSFHTQKTDLSEVGLCSLNIMEFTYNQLLLLIQQKNWQMAIKKMNELLSSNPATAEQSKSLKQLFIVRAMINQELGLMEKYNQDLTIYLKNFGQISKNKQGAVVIEPFDTKGRLCSQFDPIPMNFSKPKTKSSFTIWMRPSFSMPFIKPPNMIPNINEEEVQSEFNLKQIDAPMPEAPWVRQCQHQNFQPQNYLFEFQNEQMPKERAQKNHAALPQDSASQQFLKGYFQRHQQLIYDEKLMDDIDDLSDTDKVSLISDLELQHEQAESDAPRNATQTGELDLNLKNINKINQEQRTIKRVNNGLSIAEPKYFCGHKRSCSSCYRQPLAQSMVNVTNQEQLMEQLTMSKAERLERAKESGVYRGAATQAAKDAYEDTVSEADLDSSDEDEEADSNADRDNSRTKEKPGTPGSSKYSHSRFSSNAGLSELEIDIAALQAEQNQQDIDAQELQIGGADLKQLANDKRNLLQADGGKDKQVLKIFNKQISSIQLGQGVVDDHEEPMQQTPPKKQGQAANKAPQERESMVVMGSKNLDAANKKKKKSSGLGRGGNLKKNKLAIAFNNLEVEQNQNRGAESDRD